VADNSYGAIIAKRRLVGRLAAMRRRNGLNLSQASDKLGWERGRLDRFERNEWRKPDVSVIRDMARIYGASPAEQAMLEELGVQTRQRMWWRSYEDVFGKGNEFPGFENDAARISLYLPLALPALMQTRAYMEAILAVGPWPVQWRERTLQARLRRQQILDRTDGTAPRVVAVITEAALLYHWGTPHDRRTQIEHLAALNDRPNIEVRVLRFAGGLHPGMSSVIDIFDFPDDTDPSVVYLENDTSIQELTKPAHVQAYKKTFAQVRDSALAPAATSTYLHQLTNTPARNLR
jgi:transcriptional regulator with XRE-family HTH domain